MKSIAQIWRFAFSPEKLEEAAPPSPYEIALRFGSALLASPKFADDHAAAVSTAWALVMPYYQGQGLYEQIMRNAHAVWAMQTASPNEGSEPSGGYVNQDGEDHPPIIVGPNSTMDSAPYHDH